jgi:hypothetical protein
MTATSLKTKPPLEGAAIEAPEPDTVMLVSGSGAFVGNIDLLREFNAHGVKPGELTTVIAALEDQEAEEDMVSAWPRDTGLDNAIKIIPGNPRHGPRIKVAIDPPHFTDGGLTAVMPFGKDTIGDPIPKGVVSAKIEQQLREFIELNRAVLLAVDRRPEEGGISGLELGKVLRKIQDRKPT